MAKITYQERIARLEAAKKRAHDSRDSIAYFRLCNQLGCIDDQELYEQGNTEVMMGGRMSVGTNIQTVCDGSRTDAQEEVLANVGRLTVVRI